jgi:hypothetical protein
VKYFYNIVLKYYKLKLITMPTQFGKFISKAEADNMFDDCMQLKESSTKKLETIFNNGKPNTFYVIGENFYVFNKEMLKQLMDRLEGENDAIVFYQACRPETPGRPTLLACAYNYEEKTSQLNLQLATENTIKNGGNDVLEHSGGGPGGGKNTIKPESVNGKSVYLVQNSIKVKTINPFVLD